MPSDRASESPSQLTGPSHYQLLGVDPQVAAPELRQAFRSLSKRFHPDTTTLPAAEAQEAFARLQQAYAVLADPDRRRLYDDQLRRLAERRQASLQAAATAAVVTELPRPGARPIGVRRSLSGGEWFALVLLALALVLSLILGFGVAWARGTAMVTPPSWMERPQETGTALLAQAGAAERVEGSTAGDGAGG